MEAFVEFVKNWGYVAVFLGSLVEGEMIMLTAGAMASQGYLDVHQIILVAFVGTTFSEQVLYVVGWRYGDKVALALPRLKPSIDKGLRLLKKYDILFIIVSRYIYGIRIAGSIVVGAAKVSPKRFIPLNIVSAIVWATLSAYAGYYLGYFIFEMIERVENVQKLVFVTIVVLVGMAMAIKIAITFMRRRRS